MKHPAAVALGSIRSPKKAASSRENGKKGGRPLSKRVKALMACTRILASYDCAGIGQDVDDVTPCGECGPCEANALLRSLGER